MTADAPIVLDRAAVRAIDAAAIEEYGIPGLVLMENAARGLASIALDMLAESGASPGRVLIVCGRGNNGGDGYALARHLANAGASLSIVALGEPRAGGDARVNASICQAMNLPIAELSAIDDEASFDLVVDAISGTGLDRAVEGPAADAIEWINGYPAPVLAVDAPSGLDCDRGVPLGPTVRATRTVTFVALKPGFLVEDAAAYTGTVSVADIGAPAELIKRLADAP